VFGAIAFFYSLDGGVLLFPAVLLTYAVTMFQKNDALTGHHLKTEISLYALGAGATSILIFLAIFHWGAIGDAFQNVWFVKQVGMTRIGKPTPVLCSALTSWLKHPFLLYQMEGVWQRWWFPLGLYMVGLTAGLWKISVGVLYEGRKLFLLACGGIFFFVTALGPSDYIHWLKATPIFWPLCLLLVHQGGNWREFPTAKKVDAGLVATLTLLLVGYPLSLIRPFEVGGYLNSWTIERLAFFGDKGLSNPQLPRLGFSGNDDEDHFVGVVDRIHRYVPPGKFFFDFTSSPIYYYWADVKNPTRYADVDYVAVDPMLEDVLKDLAMRSPASTWASAAQPAASSISSTVQSRL
jgi:hypothetical protein